jgi:hypothetical protein
MANVTAAAMSTAIKAALNVAPLTTTHGVQGFYNAIVKPGITRPYVRWQLLAAEDEETIGLRCYTKFTYLVEGVTRENYTLASDIADAIDTILQRGTLTITGGTHDATWRTQPMERPNVAKDGTPYWHVGGIYVIGVQT